VWPIEMKMQTFPSIMLEKIASFVPFLQIQACQWICVNKPSVA